MARIAVRKITLVSATPKPRPCWSLREAQPVAEVGAERPGQDVGEPEGQHGVGPQSPADHDRDDQPGRQQHRRTGSPSGEFQDPIAGGSTEGERDQNRQPVEQLSRCRRDAVDRKCALTHEPHAEHDSQ